MNFQKDKLTEAGGAILTLKWFVFPMRLFVLYQIHLLVESGRAKRARKQLVDLGNQRMTGNGHGVVGRKRVIFWKVGIFTDGRGV